MASAVVSDATRGTILPESLGDFRLKFPPKNPSRLFNSPGRTGHRVHGHGAAAPTSLFVVSVSVHIEPLLRARAEFLDS